MQCRITDLRCKEIINICDGKRIGYAEDVDLVLPEGRVCASSKSETISFWLTNPFREKPPLRSATAAGIFENSLSVAAPCGTIEPNLPESAEKRQKILANQFLL